MSLLLVKSPNYVLQRFELSKNQPLSIGSHSISDIQLDDEGVALIEARISWSKKQFDITSAGDQGILVNGNKVNSAGLTSGDRFVIGSTQFLFTTESDAKQLGEDPFENKSDDKYIRPSDEIGLAPITDEIPAWQQQSRNPLAPVPNPQNPSPPPQKTPALVNANLKTPKQSTPPPELKPSIFEDLTEEEVESNEVDALLPRAGTHSGLTNSTNKDDSTAGKLRDAMSASRQRPGERELFRSPLVMGLTLGAVFLLIGAVVLWSLINLEEADRYLARAREQAEQRKFQQAITDYEQYLLKFPYDAENKNAHRELSLTHARSYLDIGVPDLSAGYAELEKLIARHRDEEGFNEMHGNISQYAAQIANEACEEAAEKRDTSIFQLSESALRLVDLYTAEKDRAEQIHEEVKVARRSAEASILKHTVFDQSIKKMETALQQGSPAELMSTRRDLISRYESATTDSRISKLLNDALHLDKISATQSQEARQALKPLEMSNTPLITLAASTRISKEELPSNRAVILHAADCLYGVDSATGEPIWRRHIGWNINFFPIEVTIGEPAILCHSPLHRELQFLLRDSGKLIWRQPLDEKVTGPPLIVGTEAFITTEQGNLIIIDINSGLIISQLTVSQSFSTSVELLADKKHLLAIGNQNVIYLLSRNPLELRDVLYTGHGPGAISVTPLRLGPFLLIAENDRSDSCLLRLFDTRIENMLLSEVAEERLPGNISDTPVLRGNELFVPTSPERVTAFTVSEEQGVPPLVKVDSHQVVNPKITSTWLSAGPDGQVWIASTALRRLKLLTETLEASSDITALGYATQPMQLSGENLFVARRSPSTSSVRLSRYDRNTFTGTWRTTLGNPLRQHFVNSAGELITLQDSGDIFRIRKSNILQYGFETNVNASLDLPELLEEPPRFNQFSDGRFAVAWGGDDPQLATIRSTGQIESTHKLPASPTTIPIDFQAGTTLGLPGRLHLIPRTASSCDDYVLPVIDGKQEQWTAIVRVDEKHLLCLDSSHTLRRIEYRPEPIIHLALAGELTFETPVTIAPTLTSNNHLVIIDQTNRLITLDSTTLQPVASRKLQNTPTKRIHIANDMFFLEFENGSLGCFSVDEQLTEQWSLPLEQNTIAGIPLRHDNHWLIPTSHSGVWKVSATDGKILDKLSTPGSCLGNPFLLNETPLVPLSDGSLFMLSIEPKTENQP